MQFYESILPSENTLVAIRITDIFEYGVEATLLEYDKAPRGIIFNKDLSRKRVRSIKDVARIGQEMAAVVIRVADDSIDLSLRLCTPTDVDDTLRQYRRNKAIHNILCSVAYNSESNRVMTSELQNLYETVVWPIARQELDVYDAFLQLHNPVSYLPVDTPYMCEIRALVQQRLPSPIITKSRDIPLRIPESLHAPGELVRVLNDAVAKFECEAFVIAPPLYRFQVTGASDVACEEKLDAIEQYVSSQAIRGAFDSVDASGAAGPTFYKTLVEFPLDMAEIAQRQATMNLGTLGNVSEGKSTFVRALSRTATQRHKKEKVFNVTINLGYAGFKLWRDKDTGDLRTSTSGTMEMAGADLLGHYSFADCPGHEAYLATMLSGAAIMDAAALIIASNSPTIPQMQTQEHLIAAEIMGLRDIFVVQNKLDTVDAPTIRSSLEKIRNFVRGTVAKQAPILPMSAQREWGLGYALHHIAYNIPTPIRAFDGPVRMQIVRSFDINRPQKWIAGESTLQGGVIGGTIQRGVLHPGDFLEIRPGLFVNGKAIPILTQVTTLSCDEQRLSFAIAGGLIGVGTTLDPASSVANALAGQVAGTPGTLPPITTKIKGQFRSFDRSQVADENAGGELTYKFKKHKEEDPIRLCVGSMTVSGHISKVGKKGARTIKLDRPICIDVGQICSILRSNGSRELLDGVITVESVSEYGHVQPWDPVSENLATACRDAVVSRRYTVIPNDRVANAAPLPTYDCMLDAIETLSCESQVPTSMKIAPPVVQRLPKKTAWLNPTEVLACLTEHSPPHDYAVCIPTHFQGFLKEEFSTTLTVKQEGQYILGGRFTEANFRSILKKYILQYKRCRQCNSCKTCLLREDRTLMLLCGDCTSKYSVAS